MVDYSGPSNEFNWDERPGRIGYASAPGQGAPVPAATSDTYEFVSRLNTAINGEYNALRTYGALIDMTQDDDFKEILQSIRYDESTHFQNLSHIYANLTRGMRPTLSDKPLPDSFTNGIEESIQDELSDSKFYQETSLYAPNRRIREVLMNASHDEARHSVWFTYIWNKPLHH